MSVSQEKKNILKNVDNQVRHRSTQTMGWGAFAFLEGGTRTKVAGPGLLMARTLFETKHSMLATDVDIKKNKKILWKSMATINWLPTFFRMFSSNTLKVFKS